jgi:NADPH2 dehydrogenase
MASLFSEYELKGFLIKNRIVMPPMVCFGWAGRDGLVTEEHVRHYEARAEGGVGLIIIEATCVHPGGRLADSQLGLWDDNQVAGFARLAEACHRHGARVLVQIHHAGFKASKDVTEVRIAPSDYSEKDVTARALTIDEIHGLQKDFIAAAVRAKEAGLDGVELHGAHGYLISQFLSPIVNKREDDYGGSLENRTRFVTEMIAGIKQRVGEDFIVGCRMGGNEPSLENGMEIARLLEKHGVDLLHVSAGIASDELPEVPEGFRFNWIVYCGVQIKKHVKVPVITVNGIRTPEQACSLIEQGLSDFVAVGKGLLVDAKWADKAKAGSGIIECLECKRCSWFKSGKLCPRNKH